jgi:metal-responsive CopG/Arc/MetJ family transcriptional regulator
VKTALSIPNEVYEAAERLAARPGLSRSELYAKAVEQYVKQYEAENLAALINQACEEVGTSLDPALRKRQDASLTRDDQE